MMKKMFQGCDARAQVKHRTLRPVSPFKFSFFSFLREVVNQRVFYSWLHQQFSCCCCSKNKYTNIKGWKTYKLLCSFDIFEKLQRFLFWIFQKRIFFTAIPSTRAFCVESFYFRFNFSFDPESLIQF